MTTDATAFEPLGLPPPTALTDARVELHWAAQVVAAAGRALIPAVADDSHMSLEWSAADRLLMGGMTPRHSRLGLRPSDLTLVVVDADGGPQCELALAGRTLDQALAWVAETVGGAERGLPSYEMPDHVVGHGGAFGSGDRSALAELARWYATADALLRDFVGLQTHAKEHASPVRCWPHHFDIATLVSVPGGAPGQPRSIGVGLSPGDSSYAEPYFYVTPWPYPQAATLPALPDGATWHRTGWFGAVLTATGIFRDIAGSPPTRGQKVREFLDLAARASAALLGAPVANI